MRLGSVADAGGDLRGAALDLEPARQHTRARATGVDRGVHRARDRIEPRLDLRLAAVRELIFEHHFGKALARCRAHVRSEEHTSELQSLMRISYAVFCLKKKKKPN